ncbi:MAG: polyphenol oxidase family protein [Actinobacteria bacterium]|nr:polyphenol oxidase family protein [Actinomycetota bacterium]
MIYFDFQDTPVKACWTGIGEGDLSGLPVGSQRSEMLRWLIGDRLLLRVLQVHGSVVVTEDAAGGQSSQAPSGDAIVATGTGRCLVILTADCMPVALASSEGIYGAVHAGWRGLMAGVLENAVSVMRRYGATKVYAAVGPSIGPCCYEFSQEGAMAVAGRFGMDVMTTSHRGAVSLDLARGAATALGRVGATVTWQADECTACSGKYFSYRSGDLSARQAMCVWRED